MAMQAALGVSRVLIFVGAGYTGTVLLNNGKLSDVLAELQNLLMKHEKDGETDGGSDIIAAQVRRLAMEVRQLASARPITVLNGGSGQNSLPALVVPAAALGALGYGYMWWKGISFSDLMYVTKRNMASAVENLTKHLEHVSDALAATKRHLTQKIENLDTKLDEQVEITKLIKNEVTDVRGDLSQINYDLDELQRMVSGLDGKLLSLEAKQELANTGVLYLCSVVDGKRVKMPDRLQEQLKIASKITAHDEIREDIGNNTLNGKGTTSFDAKFSAGAFNYSSTMEEPQEKDHKPYQYLRAEVYNGNRQQDASDNTTFSSPDKVHLLSGCDITKGKWVFDETYPLYRNTTCPFIDEGFNCEANGRLDKDYMKWRWQPSDCYIPGFNATKMLELIRGKRMVFVGDSINRNQWESMLCLLMGAIKDPKKVYETRGRKITKEKGNYSFKFVDYKCTVEFYVSHFLVHESKARLGKKRMQTLRIDTIDRGSSRWTGADILVFNTAHWWNHHKTKAGTNYYQEGDQIHPRLQVSVAFERALTTWASWVDKYINPRRTRVFFRSSSPSHFSGGQWNTGGHCKEARQPTNATLSISPVKNRIVEEVLRQMKTPVAFLSITGLSNYRIDGHPSIYGRKSETSNFSGMEDCSHWCLPGVPDSWNDLLYYHLLFNGRNSRNPYF